MVKKKTSHRSLSALPAYNHKRGTMIEEILVHAVVDVKFFSYGKKIDRKLKRHIEKWIRDALKSECSYIPIYPESGIEDSTRKTEIVVWSDRVV